MTTENDIEEYKIIDEILSSNNREMISILNSILNNYKMKTDFLLEQTSKYLRESTDLFWEKVIKDENYSNTYSYYPAYPSNHLAWTIGEEHVTQKGKKYSKTIRCANNDTFFTITEKTEDYTPDNIECINPESYDEISYQDVFNIIIKNDKNSIIKDALIHTFKELMYSNINEILKEYYDRMDNYKKKIQNKNKKSEEKITDNNRILLIINDQISMYQRVLETLGSFDNDEFTIKNRLFLNDKEYRKMNMLPSKEDVLNNITDFEETKEEQKETLDEKALKIEKNNDNKYGWTWNLFCNITNEYTTCYGKIKRFINAPSELMTLINHVKYFLTKISFTYTNDIDYPLVSYNRKSYDSSLGYGYFSTCETGNLNCFINNEKSTENEILEHIAYIEDLIKKLEDFDIKIDITDDEIQREMTDELLDDIGQGALGYPLIEDEIDDDYFWNMYSATYNKQNIIDYCNTVKRLISQIKEIIESSRENNKKAEFLRKYVDFYNKLFTKYAAITQYNKLLDKCNQRKEVILKDNSDRYDEIASYEEEINNIKSTKSNIKKLTKRRD